MNLESLASPRLAGQGSSALVVDDEPVSRGILTFLLRGAGFLVETAGDGREAIELIRRRPDRPFDVVFSDVEMPRLGGFELLSLVNAESPATATVIVTAHRERELVSASLRGGAVEFLDKPFDLPATLAAARRALDSHRRRRHQIAAQNRLTEIADIHRRLNRSGLLEELDLPARLVLHTRFHALHEAGGDLVKVVFLAPHRALLVLADVSGHGIQEGFLAAYFQGVIEGMARHEADARAMAAAFNEFLHTRWNDRSALAVNTSLAATFVEIDLCDRRFAALDCGGVGTRLVSADGSLLAFDGGGAALGWFRDLDGIGHTGPVSASGQCWLWSDGLEEHAARLRVPSLALAWRLLLAPEDAPPDEKLAGADDDIVVCRLDWEPPSGGPRAGLPWSPLHVEEHAGDSAGSIDRLQESWDRVLALALRDAGPSFRHDVALCAREALLNALEHGCRGDPALCARLSFLLDASASRLLLRVSNEGPGFDPAAPPPPADPEHLPLGLDLIRALAVSVEQSADGRRIEAAFELPRP